jgi:hypothetical protein
MAVVMSKHSRERAKRGGHGGKRANPGRPPVLSQFQMIVVGSKYQEFRRELANANYESRLEKVRVHQNRAYLIPKSQRKTKSARETLSEISDDIDSLLPKGRVTTAKRPYGVKAKATDLTISGYRETHNIVLTARRVEAAVKQFRTARRALQT